MTNFNFHREKNSQLKVKIRLRWQTENIISPGKHLLPYLNFARIPEDVQKQLHTTL